MALLKRGEVRLLAAVEQGHLPVHVAIQISLSPDDEQKALHEAYEKNELRGEKLKLVQKLLEVRQLQGKGKRNNIRNRNKSGKKRILTGQDILNIYQKEVARKQMLTRKADRISRQILFITTALKQLFQEDHFTTLLRAEGMTCTPKQLGQLIGKQVDE